jgi:aerobic C4-dicarboxylate transport protein
VIGEWENAFDTEQARKVLRSRTTTPPQAEVGTIKVR